MVDFTQAGNIPIPVPTSPVDITPSGQATLPILSSETTPPFNPASQFLGGATKGTGGAASLNVNLPSQQTPVPETAFAGAPAPLIIYVVRWVLGRGRKPAAVLPINLSGQSIINIRLTYHDLHMEPGFRGLIYAPPAAGAPTTVTITNNYTGFAMTIAGASFATLPFHSNHAMIDLTIAGASPFPAGTNLMLTEEEQIPFMGAV